MIAIAVLLVGSIAASFADRLGAPTLLVFLALGMLLGEDGPGGIHFDDFTLARDAGTVALIVILLEGGLLAERSEVVAAIGPAGLLATLGVLVTAGVVSVFAHVAIGLGWTTALLLGAAVSSTDAAAVFSALRGSGVRHHLAGILEAESGLNDPFAAMLVIGLVGWSTTRDYSFGDGLLLLARQAGIGALGGLAVGAAGVWLLRRLPLDSAGLAPVITVSVALAGAVGISALEGSGLLAAYLIGLVIGEARIPHATVVRGFLQGAAWLAQLGLFVLLGLLVTPSRVLHGGAAPILVAVALVLVARPLAVALCTTPFRLPLREQGFLAWAGLRGGVPIVLATFPVAAGVEGANRVFDAVFFVVVLSVAAQGLTMRWAARRLGLTEPASP
jgi:potassium/hydrogen antiporter